MLYTHAHGFEMKEPYINRIPDLDKRQPDDSVKLLIYMHDMNSKIIFGFMFSSILIYMI